MWNVWLLILGTLQLVLLSSVFSANWQLDQEACLDSCPILLASLSRVIIPENVHSVREFYIL